MKRIFSALFFTTATIAWSPTSFAQRQQAVGPGIIPLNAAGSLNGVDLSASATTGTLSVGVPGGPQANIFTLNNPPVAGLVAVSTAASSQGNIIFNSSSNVFGAIGATQPAGPFLLGISGGNAGTTVNFMGPVFATTLNVAGTGAMNFNSGSVNITATNFGGDGTISLAPNTTLIGALTTTAGANTGTLSLGSASVLDGAVGGAVGLRAINVVGGNDTAGATATITGAANAFSFNLGTNTLNVDGALTVANGGPNGVINTSLASPIVYGNIRPVGATNLGPALLVNVTVPSTAFIPVGTQFNIVQTRTGTVQSGTNGSVVSVSVKDPTNPLYTFSAVPPAGTVAGLVAIRTTSIPVLVPIAPPPGVVLPPTAPVAAPIVPVIIALAPPVVVPTAPPVVVPTAPPVVVPTAPPAVAPVVAPAAPPAVAPNTPATPTPDIINVLAPLNAISDPAVVVNAVAQLAPSASDQAAPLVTFQGARQFQNLWSSRMDNSLCSLVSQLDQKPASCQNSNQRGGWWMKGFGYVGSQGAQDAFVGYNAGIVGAMIAYDVPVGPNTRVGVGVGYARSTIGAKTFDAHTDSNTYQAIAYIGHERGPWFVNGDVSFGWNEYSGKRNIVFPGLSRTARADFSGQDYTVFGTTGFHFKADGFTITPFASLQYTRVNLNDYTETGAGDINLKVRGRNYDFLESGLGVKVARAFRPQDSTVLYVPEVHATWLHELVNPKMSQAAAFTAVGSSSFSTPGFRTAADTLNVGAGITLLTCSCSERTWSLRAVYDYYRGSNAYSAHQGTLKFTRKF
jgi:outer membrane autotransporter protein